MRPQDLVKFAWNALTDRKLRATLTIIGIVIGPATIVALLGVTQGFSNSVSSEFSKLGSTSILLTPSGRGSYLTYADIPLIQKLPGVSVAVPYWLLSGTIKQGTQTTSVEVMATDFTLLSKVIPSLSLYAGANPTSSDLAGADIGWSIAHPSIAGASSITINEIVTVSFPSTGVLGGTGLSGQKSFVVRGIYSKFGQGIITNPDASIFVTLSEGQALTKTNHYSGIVVVASSEAIVNQVVNELTKQYSQNYMVLSVTTLVSTIQSITSGVSTILIAIAGISVVVAFIGIMTTMFTAVVERTKEIGILKALGYSRYTIMSIFLTEASITGFIGGIIGATAGVGLSYVIVDLLSGIGARSQFAGAGAGFTSLHIVPSISPELFLLAIILATTVGALAGLVPAYRASRLLPVEALYST